MRLLLLGIALCAAAAGCRTAARIALLPPVQTTARDPNPTRPLVETPQAPPWSEDHGRAPRSPATIGPVDAAVSGAAVLTWLLGGAAPVIGVYGTFDETSWFQRKPAEEPPQ